MDDERYIEYERNKILSHHGYACLTVVLWCVWVKKVR